MQSTLLNLQKNTIESCFNTCKQSSNQSIVTSDRNSLIDAVEIVVIKHKTQRQSANDKGR